MGEDWWCEGVQLEPPIPELSPDHTGMTECTPLSSIFRRYLSLKQCTAVWNIPNIIFGCSLLYAAVSVQRPEGALSHGGNPDSQLEWISSNSKVLENASHLLFFSLSHFSVWKILILFPLKQMGAASSLLCARLIIVPAGLQ